MKKTFRTILSTLLITVCTLTFFSCNKAPVVWETDWSVAQANAEAENKDFLIFFSGNEWDGLSPALMDNFLSNKNFMKEAGKNFILLTADTPEDVSAMDDNAYTDLMLLTTTCGVNTCPSIIICDRDGSPYYEITYQDGITTLDDMIADIKQAAAVRKTITQLESKLETALGAERVKVIDELVSSIPEAYIGRYYELMATIPVIDPDNESGLVGKYTLVAAEQRATMLLYQGDYLGALDEFANASDNNFLSISQKQECLYYAAYFAAQMDLWEEAIKYMERAYIFDPDSDTGKMISEMLPVMRANLAITQSEEEAEEE